jgi:hypothetical protein
MSDMQVSLCAKLLVPGCKCVCPIFFLLHVWTLACISPKNNRLYRLQRLVIETTVHEVALVPKPPPAKTLIIWSPLFLT